MWKRYFPVSLNQFSSLLYLCVPPIGQKFSFCSVGKLKMGIRGKYLLHRFHTHVCSLSKGA